MDASRFDRLSKALAGANTRRSLVQAAAVLAIAGVPVLPVADAKAKGRGKRQGVGAEHFRHKKRFYCLNGETIRRYRRKQETLLAMGATLGKCGDVPPPPCVPTTCEELGVICDTAPDGCGGTLECGTCDKGLTCCSGQCVDTFDDDNNCGTCGNVCDTEEFFQCFEGECQQL
jgi:hypothetical protein